MGLNKQEITQLITKLREKYDYYEQKYNHALFNRGAFEDRLNLAVQKKMNLEGFILSEISHFEKLKTRYDKKKNDISFSERVDEIMEENAAKIQKYPPVFFHPDAHMEIIHLYGALKEFATERIPVLRIIVKEFSHKNTLNKIEDSLSFLAVSHGAGHSKRILDHIAVLSRPPGQRHELDIEKNKNDYLRESAFILHEIIAFCRSLMQSRDPDWDYPLQFDRLNIEGETKKRIVEHFSGSTGCGAIFTVQEKSSEIIENFRLGAFKGPQARAF